MKKSAIGAAATVMFVLSPPTFAAGPPNDANNATKAMSGSVQQTPNTGGVAPENGDATQGQSKVNAAISAMRSSGESAKRVESMKKVAFVRIVDIGTDAANRDRTAIEKTAGENRSGIKGLQEAIRANTRLGDKLKEKSVKPENVLATKLNDDGSLTVYVDKSVMVH